jgi:hypothetical protein
MPLPVGILILPVRSALALHLRRRRRWAGGPVALGFELFPQAWGDGRAPLGRISHGQPWPTRALQGLLRLRFGLQRRRLFHDVTGRHSDKVQGHVQFAIFVALRLSYHLKACWEPKISVAARRRELPQAAVKVQREATSLRIRLNSFFRSVNTKQHVASFFGSEHKKASQFLSGHLITFSLVFSFGMVRRLQQLRQAEERNLVLRGPPLVLGHHIAVLLLDLLELKVQILDCPALRLERVL